MDRLADFIERHRRGFLAVWALAFVVALLPFSHEADHLTSGGYEVPGSGSHIVESATHLFPKLYPNAIGVLLTKPSGGEVSAADLKRAHREVAIAAAKVPGVKAAPESSTVTSFSGAAAAMPLEASEDQNKAIDIAVKLRTELPSGAGDTRYYLVGQPAVWAGYDAVSKTSLVSAESFGFPVTLVILIAVFGSIAAALLPLALGFISIVVTGAVIYGLAKIVPMSIFVSNGASLIGIAVGVDYSLFLLSRYRQAIKEGAEPPTALRTAMRTSGRAVVFSGISVVIALAGLFLVDSVTLTSMALGAIVVVTVAVVGALTLTPAAILTFGDRLQAPSPRIGRLRARLSRRWRTETGPSFWARWANRVTRRPGLALVASVSILVVLAIPTFSMSTVTEALPQLPRSSDARIGAEKAIKEFGPVASGATYVVADYNGPVNRGAQREIEKTIAADRNVVSVEPPMLGTDRRHQLFSVATRRPQETSATRKMVERLRLRLAQVASRTPGLTIAVGGTAAHEVDFNKQVTGALWKVILFILIASALVVLILLRSLVLPIKAIVMNVLTVAASFGVLVAIFQWRWFNGLISLQEPGYVATLALPFVLAVMFGLSMDYEVFLLARVQEEYRKSKDTRAAVAAALETSAGTITSAAVIMCVVFLVFVAVSLATIKMLGLGLAVAVALDATLVRLVLVPAAVVLMGRLNWWAPGWLRRRSYAAVSRVAAVED